MAGSGRPTWLGRTPHNKNIGKIEREKNMVMRANVRLFVLVGAWGHDKLAQNVVNSIHKLHQFLHKYSRYGEPFIARLYMAAEHKVDRGKGGEIKKWLLNKEWPKE